MTDDREKKDHCIRWLGYMCSGWGRRKRAWWWSGVEPQALEMMTRGEVVRIPSDAV